jgi:hypothetical protein
LGKKSQQSGGKKTEMNISQYFLFCFVNKVMAVQLFAVRCFASDTNYNTKVFTRMMAGR